jgi:hypothetical protein
MAWKATISCTKEEDPLLKMQFLEWQMNFMESSLTILHHIEGFILNEVNVSCNENKEKARGIKRD